MMHEYEFDLQLDGPAVFRLIDELSPLSDRTDRVHGILSVKGNVSGPLKVSTTYLINPDLIEFYLRNWSKP